MSEQAHILVVDDEAEVRKTLQEYLTLQDFKVTALSGGAALRAFVESNEPFDLVLLDIAMPKEDGLSLVRFLREKGDVAIIMVTAAIQTVDKIVGLEVGADDYLAKPVDLRELLARIKAVMRRGRAQATLIQPQDEEHEVVVFGRCFLDLDAHKLYDEDGDELALTAMEFDLLRAFAERPNRVLSRNQLLEIAHNRSWSPFDRSVDIRIARLRRKVERDPGKPQVIKTVHGTGYVFAQV